MEIETLVKLIATVATFVISTLVPLIISLVKANKRRKEAKTEAEKQGAINDMAEIAKTLIVEAEELYKDYDKLMKSQNSTGGAVKKKTVMTELHAYALEKGYKFDAEFWGNQIDSIVDLTRKVNVNK